MSWKRNEVAGEAMKPGGTSISSKKYLRDILMPVECAPSCQTAGAKKLLTGSGGSAYRADRTVKKKQVLRGRKDWIASALGFFVP
jgi:hypothetical protein